MRYFEQVVCKTNLEFCHVFSGFPGSMHDARVFYYSGLQQKCNEDFADDTHLLADSAYTLQERIMTPFRDVGILTEEETHFNRMTSGLRATVERSIGLLKMRWRILLDKCHLKRIEWVPFYTVACCTLHNICLKPRNALLVVPIIPPDVDDYGGYLEPTRHVKRLGRQKRDRITIY